MNSPGWAWAALALYVVGLLLAFGMRTWMQWRTTGTTGFRGISGRPGSLTWWGGVLFPVALLLGLAAPVLVLTGTTPRLPLPAYAVVATVGLLLGLGGLAVTLEAQRAMGTSWRIGVDESERIDLVTSGPFRRVRNPIFTGMAGVSVGVLLMVPTVVAALAVVCLVAAVHIQVRTVEEPYLRRVHGDAYVAYAASSRRFLPQLARARTTRSG